MRQFRNVAFGVLAISLLSGCGGDGDSSNSGGTKPAKPMVAGSSASGLVDGTLSEARFNNPVNVAVAPDGTVYVADFDNSALRAISPAGVVSTVVKRDDFFRPFGLAIASNGTVYIQTDGDESRDTTKGTLWTYDPATKIATAVAHDLGRPRGMVALADGRIALSNLTRNNISIFDPANSSVMLLAGANDGTAGFANGVGAAARFARPYGLDQLSDGSLLVADQTNNRIRQVTLDGTVTTYAGTGEAGDLSGPTASATFNAPQAVSISPNGSIFVADQANHKIRLISGGIATDFAGDGKAGYRDGVGAGARFYGLEGIGLTPDGRVLWIADGNGGDGSNHNRVRSLGVF